MELTEQTTTAAETNQEINYDITREGVDAFNGHVCIYEDLDKTGEEKRFWVEQQRKDVYSDFVDLETATALFDGHIADTMF